MNKSKKAFFKKIINEKNFTYRNVLNFINGIEINNKKILDAGCGNGNITLYLAEKGGSVTGVDKSSEKIKISRNKAKTLSLSSRTIFKKRCLENTDEQFFNQFDLIVCCEVLEHIQQDQKVINNFYKYLKPEGALVISVPSKKAPLFILGISKKMDQEVNHLRRYSPESITNKISKAGFQILTRKEQEGILRNSMFFLKITKPLLKITNKYTFLSNIITFLDNLSIKFLGTSQIMLIASKK